MSCRSLNCVMVCLIFLLTKWTKFYLWFNHCSKQFSSSVEISFFFINSMIFLTGISFIYLRGLYEKLIEEENIYFFFVYSVRVFIDLMWPLKLYIDDGWEISKVYHFWVWWVRKVSVTNDSDYSRYGPILDAEWTEAYCLNSLL